jgi:hexosaminidase
MIAAVIVAGLFAPSIIPRPAHMLVTGGAFVMPGRLIIRCPEQAIDAAEALVRLIKPSGVAVELNPRHNMLANVQFTLDEGLGRIGNEGYRLEVTEGRIVATAPKPAGLFYAAQSLRQMLPADLESSKKFKLKGERIPCVQIEDQPRFSWRGMHLDESRHFFGVESVKKYIDLLALHKMNVFHWHLIDDGGWRIEIKKYPKLTEIGAWRRGTGKGWDYINIDFVPQMVKEPIYGGFYTQEQAKDIVEYARKRFVIVVPEIEMPGHTLPAPFNYNEVGCDPVSIEAWKKATGMRYSNVYCAGKEASFEFVQNVLDEVISIFPSEFLHIGGDEVDKRPWIACPSCQKRKADEGLKDEHELQSYFIKRVEKYLNSKGKRMIGWDEILEGGLAPNATVMSWRGISGGIEAAKSGHDVVMSPTSHCYFDYPYTSIPTEAVYGYDPIPAELTEEEGKRVLGAQGNVWTEWMETFSRVEQMAFPRACALAEAVWTPKEDKRWSDFEGRMGSMYKRLAALNVNFNLPQPTAKLDAILFRDSAKVEFNVPPFDGSVVRYSTNGKPPTRSSPIYTTPIVVTKDATIAAALFVGNVSSTPISVNCVKAPPTTILINPKMGLLATVRHGAFAKVADMASVPPVRSLQVGGFDLSVAGLPEQFGITFSGFIHIQREGVYTFSLTSDDGSVLKIAGATVVDNDGLHGAVEKSGKVYLPAGMFAFSVDFFEAGGAESLKVMVQEAGGEKVPLPFSWLAHAP